MFEQVKLGYAFDALEPHIDTATVETHYGKHHAAYTKAFNDAAQKAGLQDVPAEEILSSLDGVQDPALRRALRNNGGGFAAWNAQQRDEARARERGNRKEANALANAEKEIGRLENEERRWGRNMNPAQRERLNNLRNFRDQLIGRNDAAKEAERLQKRKDEAVINTEKRLNEIRDWLKVNGGL